MLWLISITVSVIPDVNPKVLSNMRGKIANRVQQYHNNLWCNYLCVAGF